MDADAPAAPCASHSLPPPPALFAVRARSCRLADLSTDGAAFSGPPDTPPRPSLVAVPFFWEEAPGKAKEASFTACASAVPADANDGPVTEGETSDSQDSSDHADEARPVPLKLPPRLQQVPASSFGTAYARRQGSVRADQARPLPLKLPPWLHKVASFAAADTPVTTSPSTVLHSPCHGCAGGRRTPRWVRSSSAALRRTPSAGIALLSRTWSKRGRAAGSDKHSSGHHERDAAGTDAPWFSRTWSQRSAAAGNNKNRCGIHERDAAGTDASWYSPASSFSSSSSVSTCFGPDDHGRGRPADGREVSSEEDDGSPRASVKITRFRLRRNRSVPSMTTSNLWSSIRRSVKQITPWS